ASSKRNRKKVPQKPQSPKVNIAHRVKPRNASGANYVQIHDTSCPGAGDSIKKGGEQNQSYQSRTLREHGTCSNLGSLQSTSSGPDVTRIKIQGKVLY
ncbi:hypothetical protein pdam_00018941, partial [Pocillopora damicornis]